MSVVELRPNYQLTCVLIFFSIALYFAAAFTGNFIISALAYMAIGAMLFEIVRTAYYKDKLDKLKKLT